MSVECCILHFGKVKHFGFLFLYRNLSVIYIYTSMQYHAHIILRFHIAIFYIDKTGGIKGTKSVVIAILHGNF